jgi:hypothetical protein
MDRNAVGIYPKTIKLLFLAFQAPPPCPNRCHPVAHFPSCPLSIPEISSPTPPCPHPCWLSQRPYCCAATFSCSLNALPWPCDALPPIVHFSSQLPLIHQVVIMSDLIALPQPCVTFCCAAASRVHPLPLTFIYTGWLLHQILSCCLQLPSSHQHCHLLCAAASRC